MYIVLDANVIISNYRLDTIVFKLILDNLKKQGYIVCIPEVVYMEVVNKFKEDYKNRLNDAKNAVKKLELISNVKNRLKQVKDLASSTKEYEKYLLKLSEKYDNFEIRNPGFPDVPHEEIVKRAIRKHKPFNSNEKGYRDTLIWFSVLELAQSTDKQVLFVSNNHNDFAKNKEEKDVFHSLLIEDLRRKNLEGKVILCSSIDEVFKKNIYPHLPKSKQAIAKLLKASRKHQTFKSLFSDYLINIYDSTCFHFTEYGEGKEVKEINKVIRFKTVSKVETDNINEVVFDIESTIECDIFYYESYSCLLDLEEETENGKIVEFLDPLTVIVLRRSKVNLYAYLTLDANKGEIIEMDIITLKNVDRYA